MPSSLATNTPQQSRGISISIRQNITGHLNDVVSTFWEFQFLLTSWKIHKNDPKDPEALVVKLVIPLEENQPWTEVWAFLPALFCWPNVILSHEKNPPTFHYAGCLIIGILTMVYNNPYG